MTIPTVNEDNQKMKEAEWRGYMLKTVEDIDEELTTLRQKVDRIDANVNSLYAKVAGIGAIVSLVVSMIMKEFFK